MCNKGTKNFRLVVVDSTNANTQDYDLKDEENLRTAKRIVAIEAYKVGTVSNEPGGRPVINDTVFNKSFLTISTPDSDEVLYKIPFSDLNRAGNNGQLFLVDIPPLAPSKCKIRIASTVGIVTTESFLLGFHYES